MKTLEITARTIDEAVQEALKQLNTTRDNIEVEEIRDSGKVFFGLFGSREVKVRITVKDTPQSRVEEFLSNVFEKMNVEAQIKTCVEGNQINVELMGDDMGIVIGRRGDTLDALQYLASLVANKGEEEYIRVTLDTENYRKKREETLERLANKIAAKVMRTKRSFTLEPMSPNERRIIHSTLQSNGSVLTYSTGEEPNRRVVVALKDQRKAPRGRGQKTNSFEDEES